MASPTFWYAAVEGKRVVGLVEGLEMKRLEPPPAAVGFPARETEIRQVNRRTPGIAVVH